MDSLILFLEMDMVPPISIMRKLSTTTQDNFQIIGREDHGFTRTIKEFIYIRVNDPTLNINIDKLTLHHIWNRVLLNTSGLKIKRHAQDIGHAQSTPT